jgi:hypothetical protein
MCYSSTQARMTKVPKIANTNIRSNSESSRSQQGLWNWSEKLDSRMRLTTSSRLKEITKSRRLVSTHYSFSLSFYAFTVGYGATSVVYKAYQASDSNFFFSSKGKDGLATQYDD